MNIRNMATQNEKPILWLQSNFHFSVGPHMNQAMPVTSIYLIPFFIIEKGSNVFQSLCNCASHPGVILLL
jgi:hypothetical protein